LSDNSSVERATDGPSASPIPPLSVSVFEGVVQFAFIVLETGFLYSRCVYSFEPLMSMSHNVLCALNRLVGVAKCALDSLMSNARGADESFLQAVSTTSGRIRRQSILDGNEHELELYGATGESAATLRVMFKFSTSDNGHTGVLGTATWRENPLRQRAASASLSQAPGDLGVCAIIPQYRADSLRPGVVENEPGATVVGGVTTWLANPLLQSSAAALGEATTKQGKSVGESLGALSAVEKAPSVTRVDEVTTWLENPLKQSTSATSSSQASGASVVREVATEQGKSRRHIAVAKAHRGSSSSEAATT
jgi:hypothetical protein